MNYVLRTTLILASLAALAPAAPAETPRNRPELFARLIDCRTIPDAGQRLDCYDRSVSAIEAAEKSNELVVVDRREIRETKRSLFGFTLPRISLFSGDKNDDKEEISEIESIVETARTVKGGDWSLRLANDAGTWETGSEVAVAPRAGDKVRIRKASLGSYLGQVGINRGVRFRRVK